MNQNYSPKIVLLHAVISPYKVTLFNELSILQPGLHILYYAVTEKIRAWQVDRNDIRHRYTLLNEGGLESHSWIKIAFQTWRELSRINPDILIISEYIYLPYWVGLLWAIIHSKKRIFFSESTAADHARVGWREWIKRQFVKHCHAGIAQGTQSKAYMVRLGMPEDKITIKGYSTDNQFYADGAASARSNRHLLIEKWRLSEFNILYVGRFAPEKNLFCLIDAYEQLSNRHPHVGLVLVGGGPLQPRIEAVISEKNLSKATVLPFIQRPQLPEIYGISDVFVLPSISEPWGLVVNEAMACGLPVIVSNRAGSAHDLVNPKCGFVFDPNDTAALSQHLDTLITNTEFRTEASREVQQAVSEFTSQKSALKMSEAIRRINA